METADYSKESVDSSEESRNSTQEFTNSPQKSGNSPKKSTDSPQKSVNPKESRNSPIKSVDSSQKSADSSNESITSQQKSVDSPKKSDSSKKSTNSPQKSVNSSNNSNSPIKSSEYSPDKSSQSDKQTEEYDADEQHNMISFLIEANRISLCCSIQIWRLMALNRSTRSPESLLEHFKTVIAPNIAQFLDQIGIIGLPGVLEEFRSALRQAEIKETESSSSLFATPSPTRFREPLAKIKKRKRDLSTLELVPPKKLKESTESDEENSPNKGPRSSKIRVKVKPASSEIAGDEENEGNTSLNDKNSSTSMIAEDDPSQTINDGNDDSDASIEFIESAENILIDNSKKLKVKNSEINVQPEEDLEDSENLSGEAVWQEMYEPITVGKQRNTSGRIEFNEKPRRLSGELEPTNFSVRLLNALNRSKSGGKAYCLPEELAILHYFICRPQAIQSCRGKKVFQSIERQKWKVLKGRTWEAMRKRFNSYIIGNIHEFGLPEEILEEFLYWEWNREQEREKK